MACTTTRLRAYFSGSLCGLHHHQAPCLLQQASSYLSTGRPSESIGDAPTDTHRHPQGPGSVLDDPQPTDLTYHLRTNTSPIGVEVWLLGDHRTCRYHLDLPPAGPTALSVVYSSSGSPTTTRQPPDLPTPPRPATCRPHSSLSGVLIQRQLYYNSATTGSADPI